MITNNTVSLILNFISHIHSAMNEQATTTNTTIRESNISSSYRYIVPSYSVLKNQGKPTLN